MNRRNLCLIYAIMGQLADVLTTKTAIGMGAEEGNPLVRPLVKRGKYGILTAIKVGGTVGLHAYKYAYGGETEEEKNRAAANSSLMAGTIGFAAALWNLGVISKIIKEKKNQPVG